MTTTLVIQLTAGSAILLIALIWWASTNGRLIALRCQVEEAVGTLAAQLQQRLDLMPDIRDAAREAVEAQVGYLTRILNTRRDIHGGHDAAPGYAGRSRPMNEDNPQMDVKTYQEAQRIHASTEKDIAAARRFVQAAIAEYNAAIAAFPASIVASMKGFVPLATAQITPDLARKPDMWKTVS
ncbi:MAG: LemA family protein [Verrucomicrobiota bacterium]